MNSENLVGRLRGNERNGLLGDVNRGRGADAALKLFSPSRNRSR
jgi:hypothetical protein